MSQEFSFGYWLRLKRKSLDLTREGLADRVGCSAATIRKLEAEERRPSTQIAALLAEIFSIPLNERETFIRFARGDLGAKLGAPVKEVPWRTQTTPTRSNLPAPVTALIGRDKELTDIRAYLINENIRLVTLTGPPGIGKTRLSIQAARISQSDFPDGVFFVGLAPLEDPGLILPTLFETFGYIEREDQSAERLVERIGDKEILVVLDNAEHLLNDIASLASRLLSTCPYLKVLVTSREAMRVPGEWLYPVPTLALPGEGFPLDVENASQYSALTLFAERARAVRPDFALTNANIHSVSSICAQLDGLPLAIELIATRIRLMSPQALLERMTDKFVLSTDGMRAVSARQKTLNNAIGWSHHFIPLEEQKLFSYLSVFSGGFTVEAAEAIFSEVKDDKTIADLVNSLADKSLLQRSFDANEDIRYNMLVTIRPFAMDHLIRSGDDLHAQDAHLTYFMRFAEQGDQEMHGPTQAEWMDRLESEHENFRAALDWSISNQKTEAALRLLGALGWLWEVRGHLSEARKWFDKILSLPDIDKFPAVYANLLNHEGRHCWAQKNYRDAHTFLGQGHALALKLGTAGERLLADNVNWIGLLTHFDEQNNNKARILFQQGLEIYRKWDDKRGQALATFHLGIAESGLNHADAALSLYEHSLGLFGELGDLFFIARVSEFLRYIYYERGEYEKVRMYLDQHLEIDRKLRYWEGIADALYVLGDLHRQQGRPEEAARCEQERLSIRREHGLL